MFATIQQQIANDLCCHWNFNIHFDPGGSQLYRMLSFSSYEDEPKVAVSSLSTNHHIVTTLPQHSTSRQQNWDQNLTECYAHCGYNCQSRRCAVLFIQCDSGLTIRHATIARNAQESRKAAARTHTHTHSSSDSLGVLWLSATEITVCVCAQTLCQRRTVQICSTNLTVILSSRYPHIQVKGKPIPVTGCEGPSGYETSRLPHFLNNRLTDGSDVALKRRPHFTPRKIPGTHFC
jgi:hypothetical protein